VNHDNATEQPDILGNRGPRFIACALCGAVNRKSVWFKRGWHCPTEGCKGNDADMVLSDGPKRGPRTE